MAITLQRLCEKSDYLYGMRVLAGETGMNNLVQWVHAIEDADAGAFLHGGELIFTTGIAGSDNQWLLSFVKKIKEKGAAGLVVNVGPYIAEVPFEVYSYCNDHEFPLLEVPWKTRLVDITRDFCNQIIEDEKDEQKIEELFLQLIYSEQDKKECIERLKKYSFAPYDKYSVIAVEICNKEEDGEIRERFLKKIISRVRNISGRTVLIQKRELMFFIVSSHEKNEIEDIIAHIQTLAVNDFPDVNWYMGISKNEDNILKLPLNYKKAARTLMLAKKKNIPVLFYDTLSMEKIFFSMEESDELEEYYKRVLGKLEKYDREHETGYMDLLKKYILFDGSIGQMAEVTNVHRNTINYQMNKVKKILENDMNKLEERFQIIMAFKIKEVL